MACSGRAWSLLHLAGNSLARAFNGLQISCSNQLSYAGVPHTKAAFIEFIKSSFLTLSGTREDRFLRGILRRALPVACVAYRVFAAESARAAGEVLDEPLGTGSPAAMALVSVWH